MMRDSRLTILLGERQTGRRQHGRPHLTVNYGAACHEIPLFGCLQITVPFLSECFLPPSLMVRW